MNSENSNLPSSPPSYNYATAQPTDSSANPYSSYEHSQTSLGSNETDIRSSLIDDDNDSSFGSACLECLKCCSGTMELLLCCCICFECLSQCK